MTTFPVATAAVSPARRRLLGVLVAVAAVGVLAGCGGGSSTSASSDGTSSGSGSSGRSSSKAPYTDAEACAWLKTSMPKSSEPFLAQAGLTMDLSVFFEDHGGLPNADAYALDEAVTRGCPKLHAKAIKQAGIESFGNL